MNLVFIDDGHRYLLDGKEVPSVTQILAPLYDFAGINPEVLERKRQIGTAVHKAIELHEQNDLDETSLDDACLPYFQAWLKFKAESGFVMEFGERRVVSQKYQFAGTLDLYGQINGDSALVDVKTVAAMHPASALQTAAYAHCLDEKVAKRYGLQLGPDGKYRLVPYQDRNDFNVFLSLLSIHNWKKRNGL